MDVVRTLTVTFHKDAERPGMAWWQAERAGRRPTRGGYMPVGRGVIPHDLVHLAVEGHLCVATGFWGLLARGATFKRGTDRRRTRPGRAIVATHRAQLHAAEALGNTHHAAWLAGRPT